MSMWIAAALVFLGGIGTAIQSGANGALNKTLGQPITAGSISVAATFVVFLAIIPFAGAKAPDTVALARIPWWAWIGIMFGAFNPLNAVLFADRLGSGIYIGLVTTASIIASIALDHFGLIGFEQHTAGPGRIVGCVLMLADLRLPSTTAPAATSTPLASINLSGACCRTMSTIRSPT